MIFYLVSIFIVAFIALYALMAVWAERKVSAYMQNRLGPMETGKFGLFQTFADILKLVQKEDIVPAAADKVLFFIAPVLVFLSVFMGFAALPVTYGYISSDISLGVFYLLAVVSIEVVGILMAGWSSNNKYALLGSVRSVAQIISYEIPAVIAVLSVVMLCGSLNLQDITMQQGIYAADPIYFLGIWKVNAVGGFLAWHIFQAPHLIIAFFIYFIASLAECNRAPFDIPEAESEIVAGFHIEYSGFKFAALFLAEYAMMFLVSMIAVVLFLGGWNTPLPNIGSLALADWTSGVAWGVFWIIGKSIVMVLIQMWVRWTFPRFRMDQLMSFCWKVLIPVSFGCMLISAIWKLAVI